jgi:hypothetical protein
MVSDLGARRNFDSWRYWLGYQLTSSFRGTPSGQLNLRTVFRPSHPHLVCRIEDGQPTAAQSSSLGGSENDQVDLCHGVRSIAYRKKIAGSSELVDTDLLEVSASDPSDHT